MVYLQPFNKKGFGEQTMQSKDQSKICGAGFGPARHSMKKRILNILLSGLAVYLPMSLPGATNTWIAGSGDWGVATNWSTGATPGPADYVVIGSGTPITVTHSSNTDTVISILSQQALVLAGGSLAVTSNASQLNGSFTISNGAILGASGVGTTIVCSGPANADDANFSVAGGAVMTLLTLQNYTKTCYGANWTVTGTNSVLNLPALTNITGQACNFPVIQAEAGGEILATNLASIQAGPLYFQADGAGSLINLSGLTTCAGQSGYLVTFEASSGGTIQIPHFTGGPLVGVLLNPGGTMPTAQIQTLDTINLTGVTNNFNALTNLVNLSVSGATINFPVLANFPDGNVTLSGGAVATLPALQNYTKTCSGANWTVTGTNSVLNLPALTNITGQACNFPIIQAEAGGEILATNLASIQAGPLYFQADGANSLIDLSRLTACAGQSGYLVSFEASAGGTVRIPNMPGGLLVGVLLNPGGTIPTTQIRILNTLSLPGTTGNFSALTNLVNLTVSGVTMNFPALINFDDGNLTVSGGAVVTMPALQSYTKLSCYGANWTVTGSNSELNLPALTNLNGETCNYPVIQAEAGGEILATNLAAIELAPLAFQADGMNSLIDLSGLTTGVGQNGYLLTFEASSGGTMRIPNLAVGQLVGLLFNAGGLMTPTNLTNLNLGSMTLPSGSLSLPALRNMDATSLNVSGGAALSLSGVGNYLAGTNVGAVWQASGTDSQISLPGLTNLTGDASASYPMQIEAVSGGQLLLSNLQTIANGNLAFLANGAGSTINLLNLSGFVLQNGQGNLTAENGGTILLNSQAFLLANVAVNVPAGNPVLPPTLIASSSLTLYGQAWNSYVVEERNTLIPNSPFTFLARVPLTNAFEAIAPAPPPNTAFLVTEFVANPPILDLSLTLGGQVQLVLYGPTNRTYQIQSTANFQGAITWTNNGGSVVMTNSFRILPPASPAPPSLFYRAKQL
jgi:hypothetical protein